MTIARAPKPLLRQARESRGWTQADLAERLEVTPLTIYRWELGISVPSSRFRAVLCELFQLPAESLGLIRPERLIDISAAPESSLPYGPPSWGLVGRDDLMWDVKRSLFHEPSATFAAFYGLPGVGKTALVLTIAHDPDVQEQFPDGILWAGLGPHPDIMALLGRWATVVGCSASAIARCQDAAALAIAIQTAIGSRRMLLISDDVWTIDDALAMKVGGPSCFQIITTRLLDVAAFYAPQHTMRIEELTDVHGLQLLQNLAPDAVTLEPEQAQEMVHAVGALPLALVLIGHELQLAAASHQPRRIRATLQRLYDRQMRLQIAMAVAPTERPAQWPDNTPLSLATTIAMSVEQLHTDAQALLAILALFPAKPISFPEDAAHATSGLALDQFFVALDTLLDAGLVESADQERYHIHQTITDMAQDLPRDPDATERMLRYYVGVMQASTADTRVVDEEFANIQTALLHAHREHHDALLVEGVLAFVPWLQKSGMAFLGEQQLLQALPLVTDDLTRCTLLWQLGRAAEAQGEYARQERYGHEMLALARQVKHPLSLCNAHRLLGIAALHRGDILQAQAHLEDGLRLAQQAAYHRGYMGCAITLSGIAANQGHIDQAQRYCEEAMLVAQHSGERNDRLSILELLGPLAGSQGHFAQAEDYLQEAYALAKEMGVRAKMHRILHNLGNASLAQGHFAQAEQYLREGLSLARELANQAYICDLLAALGNILIMQGEFTQAEQYVTEGIVLAREIGRQDALSDLLACSGDMAARQGDSIAAATRLQESVTIAQQLGYAHKEADIQRRWGDMLLLHGQLLEAKARFHAALQVSEGGANIEARALATFGLAKVAAAQGYAEEARRYGAIALELAETMKWYRAEEIRRWIDDQLRDSSPERL